MSWKDIKANESANAKKESEIKKVNDVPEQEDEEKDSEIQPMFEDPMDMEEVFYQESDKIQEEFRKKISRENQRAVDVLDTGYYFVVCFKSADQVTECCEMLGLDSSRVYFEGRDFMRAMRKTLKTPDPEFPSVRPFDKEYIARSMNKEDVVDD